MQGAPNEIHPWKLKLVFLFSVSAFDKNLCAATWCDSHSIHIRCSFYTRVFHKRSFFFWQKWWLHRFVGPKCLQLSNAVWLAVITTNSSNKNNAIQWKWLQRCCFGVKEPNAFLCSCQQYLSFVQFQPFRRHDPTIPLWSFVLHCKQF